jgi:hypothetical protein
VSEFPDELDQEQFHSLTIANIEDEVQGLYEDLENWDHGHTLEDDEEDCGY